MPSLTHTPFDYVAIQNTIARYCIALDTKNWDLLSQVFTPGVEAKYPFGGAMKGVKPLADKIADRLKHITSQHALTTQTISIAEAGEAASATTYFTGIHFGQGKWKGQQVTAWGRYVDELVLLPFESGGKAEFSVPGAKGQWVVAKRTTEFMGRLGEEGVMDGE